MPFYVQNNRFKDFFKTSGFEVVNLCIDIPTLTFLEEAEKANAQVIALSALLTATMSVQREVVNALADRGLRQKFKVIVGGAPIDKKWTDEIGADGYGANAAGGGSSGPKIMRMRLYYEIREKINDEI